MTTAAKWVKVSKILYRKKTTLFPSKLVLVQEVQITSPRSEGWSRCFYMQAPTASENYVLISSDTGQFSTARVAMATSDEYSRDILINLCVACAAAAKDL